MSVVKMSSSALGIVQVSLKSPQSSPRLSTASSATLENKSVAFEDSNEVPSSDILSQDSFFLEVPPTTPANQFSFVHTIENVKRPFPKLDDFKISYVREIGIKAFIETLSVYFTCPNYKVNPLQFWFLDVITDCFWKMQDEYHFPERYQKVVVEWVLCAFDLIADPKRNLSRKEFFGMFNEAIAGTLEKIQSGCEMLPKPEDLFNLEPKTEEEEISYPSTSTHSSTFLHSSGDSYVAVGLEENTEIFELPKQPSMSYHYYDDPIENSLETSIEESLGGYEESVEFYQPNPNIPDRFLSLSSSSSFQSLGEEDLSPIREETFLWKRSSVPSVQPKEICSNDNISTLHPKSRTSKQSLKSVNLITEEWKSYLDDRTELIQDIEKNIMINTCALHAIKDFIYDYFYETFQFTVAKIALMNQFHTITQDINREWYVPKVLKEELKKPKIKKEKKPKKKPKKKKTPRKKTKHGKKDKKKKKPKKGKGKKPKKPKKKKLTKEEKAELARLKREQQLLEEELRKAEENRRMLLPLKDATNDEFFTSIFEHWQKPKQKEKGGKGKKKAKAGTRRAI